MFNKVQRSKGNLAISFHPKTKVLAKLKLKNRFHL